MDTQAVEHSAKGFLITAENAKAMALRSHAARRAAKEKQAQIAHPIPESATQEQIVSTAMLRARVIDARIQQTLKAFESTNDPQDMQRLAMALDRLYNTWFNLTGHERPGVRKSVSRRQGQSIEPSAPIPPIEPIA